MDFPSWRCFDAVAAHGSFSAAAKSLGTIQSTLSRQVSALEKSLNIKLFDRLGRGGVVLTPAGRELLEIVHYLLEDEALLRKRAREIADGSRSALRLGATPQTIESFLSPLIADFRKATPGLECSFVEESSDALHDLVLRGRIDLAITTTPQPPLSGVPLYPLATLALLPKGDVFTDNADLEIRDLADRPLALFHKGYMTRRLFDGATALEGLTPRILLESRNSHILLQMAEDGLATSIVPSTLSLSHVLSRVRPVYHRDRPLSLWMCMVWHGARTLPPIANELTAHAVEFAKLNYPGREIELVRRLFETGQKADPSATIAARTVQAGKG